MRHVGLALLLALSAACDSAEPDAIKQAVGSAVQDNFAGVREDHRELSAANVKLGEQLASNAATLGQVLDRLTSLEAKLDALEQATAASPSPVAPLRPPTAGKPDPAVTYKVELGDAQVLGSDTALVTIVEWSDFQCPYCARVGPTLETLRTRYGADLRVAFKHNPLSFHNRAKPAAIAAEAAGEQGKFWEMHDKLFENSKDLTDENFIVWAKDLGLDIREFERDLDDASIATRIDAMQKEGMTLGARGTPAFFINGRFLSGAQPVASFERVIDEELVKARALVASGVPRSDVYERTIASGATEPE